MAKYQEGTPFQFTCDCEPSDAVVEPVTPNPDANRIRITGVANMMPLEIRCEIDGQKYQFLGYIDYETQRLVVDSNMIPNFEVFREKVFDFLQKRVATKYPLDLNVPDDAYEQFTTGMNYAAKVQDMEVEAVINARTSKNKGR